MSWFGHFSLSDNFIAKYKGKQPQWGPLGYITYKRTYSRTLEDGTSEEFWQTCKRVVEGTYSIQRKHCRSLGLPWNQAKAQKSAQRMFELMWDMKFLPPGRGLWAMGTPVIDKLGAAPLQNCAFVSTQNIATNFSDPFIFLMDMSMLGVGVGGDTRGAGTVTIKQPRIGTDIHIIEDSREGWVNATKRVLESYVGRDMLPARFDYSLIRPAGTPLKTFGGVAGGPQSLIDLIDNDLHSVLSSIIGEQITSTAIVDIFNFIGKCVVSGNVRRSAEIMLSDLGDEEFLDLKDPNKFEFELKDRRWASNNSVIVDTNTNFGPIAERIALNGEPGCYFLENSRAYGRMKDKKNFKDKRILGCNPCTEQNLEDRELCNLVENFMARCNSIAEWKEALKFSYLYAKTVTLIPTHNELTNAVMMRNRRIGCSISGITRAKTKLGTAEFIKWLDEGYDHIQHLDKMYSEWFCVPESIKTTSVKPSGTVSLLPGEPPGMHYPEEEYYTRIIRIADTSPLIKKLSKAGYKIEQDKSTPNTMCVYFPVKQDNFTRSKQSVSMWEQVELLALLQHYWADNMVSVTVTFKPEEAKDIVNVLELNAHRLKSISFLPLKDHGYEQAPYTPITKEEYEIATSKLKPLDLSISVHEADDKYCDGDKCVI